MSEVDSLKLTPEQEFKLWYSTPLTTEEKEAHRWFASVTASIQADIDRGDWVILCRTFRDGTEDLEVVPRFLGELLIEQIPFSPEADQIASAKLSPCPDWLLAGWRR